MSGRAAGIGGKVSRRILWISAIGFLVGWISTIGAKRWLEHTTVQRDAAELLSDRGELGRCEARPAEFVGRTASGWWLFAYDAAGRSRHPDAPPLRLPLDAATPLGGTTARRASPFWSIAELAFRTRERGPCAWLVAHRRSQRADAWALASSAAVALLAMAATLLGVVLGVVRPLLRRIGEVRALAGTVGAASPRLPEAPLAGDELDVIVAALRQADAALAAERLALARSQAALEEHVATTAHDLRTPVASLQLAVEHATAEAVAARAGEGALGALRGALLDAYYMGALVENLHLTTRLRGPARAVASVDVVALVRGVATRLAVVARHAGVSLDHAVPDGAALVLADPLALERAISNLADNAVRFARGHVALLLERRAGVDGPLELTVLDDGPGFAAEALAHAAALGIAVEGEAPGAAEGAPRSRARLGLAVAAQVARGLGATISLRRTEEGSALLLRLPEQRDVGGRREEDQAAHRHHLGVAIGLAPARAQIERGEHDGEAEADQAARDQRAGVRAVVIDERRARRDELGDRGAGADADGGEHEEDGDSGGDAAGARVAQQQRHQLDEHAESLRQRL